MDAILAQATTTPTHPAPQSSQNDHILESCSTDRFTSFWGYKPLLSNTFLHSLCWIEHWPTSSTYLSSLQRWSHQSHSRMEPWRRNQPLRQQAYPDPRAVAWPRKRPRRVPDCLPANPLDCLTSSIVKNSLWALRHDILLFSLGAYFNHWTLYIYYIPVHSSQSSPGTWLHTIHWYHSSCNNYYKMHYIMVCHQAGQSIRGPKASNAGAAEFNGRNWVFHRHSLWMRALLISRQAMYGSILRNA